MRPGHCKHVAQLVVQMEAVESRLDDLEGDEEGVGDWADSTVGAQFGPGQRRARRGRPAETPTINGPMGLLTKPERPTSSTISSRINLGSASTGIREAPLGRPSWGTILSPNALLPVPFSTGRKSSKEIPSLILSSWRSRASQAAR